MQTVHFFNEDIGMEFRVSKYRVLVMKRGKVVRLNGLVILHGQMMREIDERGYKYLGTTEMDKIKERNVKEKFARNTEGD